MAFSVCGFLTRTRLSALLALSLAAGAVQAQYPGQTKEKTAVAVRAPIQAYSFNLQDVRVLSSPFKDNMDREGRWLLSLPAERLLHSFRVNAGLLTDKKASPTKMPKPLGGWEALDMELRGHSMGHILSGLAFQFASTGNEAFKLKSDSLIAGLAQVQKALNEGGYLSAYPQNYIDRNIAGTSVWAPWYTLHKIFAGLTDAYWYTGNPQALEVEKGMASWAYQKLSPLTQEQLAKMLRNEFGGMNDAFYNLYSITGDPQHRKLAEMFYHKAVLEPLEQGQDKLNTMHANTVIPKLVGEARAYELTGDLKAQKATTFFWDDVVKHHTYAHGGNSDKEHFFEPDKISEHLTGNTGETCNTYNMLKLTRHLFTWNPEAKYADYYEQALYNHILGQQDPKTGMVSYFSPMLPGAYRLYSTPTESFWCCVGSGFESHSKYGEAIYYHGAKDLYVNLFIPSELNWQERGVKVVQNTKYPEEETTRLTIQTKKPVDMPLHLRYPAWATHGVTLKVNGKTVAVKQQPGSYITVSRNWKNGDQVELTYPMALRVIATPDNPRKAAFAYGPIILAGEMGTEGMSGTAPYHDPADPYQYYGYDYHVPADLVHTLATKGGTVTDWLKPVPGHPLTFTTTAATGAGGITMVPYYKAHRERYVVYWDLQ
ncbi:glycoside hydrolase family 127 protein [Hymenobacter jejuensis]|uniref:Glycoside hydrolase family 127 protein n=1 Tax=Hymenobacter jejuensis TaxID=2502781 RepID=A0A5B8A3E6_9BACT|nr:glycoside hydrolase family 127 protein [Hymenobacter jejuensis]QDA61649.1 glycoside hydrolase family 127 protein [Hymenobacter jejuensis]